MQAYEIAFRIIYAIYIVPLLISLLFFTIIKVEDKHRVKKAFNKDLTYKKTILISICPFANWLIVLSTIKKCFK